MRSALLILFVELSNGLTMGDFFCGQGCGVSGNWATVLSHQSSCVDGSLLNIAATDHAVNEAAEYAYNRTLGEGEGPNTSRKDLFNAAMGCNTDVRPIYVNKSIMPPPPTARKYHHCPVCDYKSHFKSNVAKHLKTHSGEKPFACPYCPYRAVQKVNLTAHVFRHLNITEK